jgi:hypothetical protein
MDGKIMRNRIIFCGLGIVAVAAVIAFVVMREPRVGTKTQGAQTARSTSSGQGVSAPQSAIDIQQSAMLHPEAFQTQTVAVREAPKPLAVPKERPTQLSEVRKSDVRGQVSGDRNPTSVESLYFHKDYESMRKEEIRNPDSKENREGVVALLKARQQRAGVEAE